MPQADDIIARLKQLDDAYFNDEPLISDNEYDLLKRKAQKDHPTHPYFMEVGSDVRGGKIKLSHAMGSLNQVYEGEINAWKEKNSALEDEATESDKLDGASSMVRYKDGQLQISYGRGNGVMGSDTTRHARKLKSVPQSIPLKGHVTIRGEMIMTNAKFDSNWKPQGYANPRNLVAGAMNRSTTEQDMLDDIEFIAYQIVDGSEEFQTNSHAEDLELLKSLGFTVVKYKLTKIKTLTDDYLKTAVKKAKAASDYLLDGIVLTVNEKSARKSVSNSSTLNPDHAFKYKIAGEAIEATVVDVHYEISQHGFQKPRVEILPVSLFGTTVTFATGFNGRFIVDNGIGPGAKIKITKGGEVIPDITEVVEPVEPKLPSEPFEWNKTGIEMRVLDWENNPTVIFKQVLQFFDTLDVELLKEANLAAIMEKYDLTHASYETVIQTITGLLDAQWVKAIGTNGSKIYASMHRRLSNLTLETYLGATKYLGFGFGVRKAKALVRGLNSPNDVWALTSAQIKDIDGFDTTADAIVSGLPKAKALLDTLEVQMIVEEKTTELAALNVVFTGFRDKEFQAKLEKAGAKVGSSVSKKTTHLLTAEPNSTSSKAVKAREIGVATMSLDEFKAAFNL